MPIRDHSVPKGRFTTDGAAVRDNLGDDAIWCDRGDHLFVFSGDLALTRQKDNRAI
jgi:hypothetical protein